MSGRLLRLEASRNVMPVLLPVLALLLALSPIARHLRPVALWYDRSGDLQSSLQVIGTITAAAAAWMAGREHRRGMTDLVGSTPRDPWSRSLTTLAATAGWAVLVYAVLAGVFLTITATQATWGGPVPWPILSGLAGLLATVALAHAVGWLVPSRFTAPLTAVGVFAVMAAATESGLHGVKYGWLSPLYSAVWGVSVFYATHPGLGLVQVTCFIGVALAAVAAVGFGAGVRRAPVAVLAAASLLVGAAVALISTGTSRDGGGVTIGALGEHPRRAPFTFVCTHDQTLQVCLHPAYARANERTVLDRLVNTIAAPLAGTPGLPVRVEQSAGPRNPPPGTLLIDAFIVQGDRIDPPAFASALESRLALQLVTGKTGPGAPATPVQRALATYLLAQAGDAPAPQLLPADPTVTAAAYRLAALDPATRHSFLAAHLPTIRAGGLTLEDLP